MSINLKQCLINYRHNSNWWLLDNRLIFSFYFLRIRFAQPLSVSHASRTALTDKA